MPNRLPVAMKLCRDRVAAHFLAGEGIEIGAGNSPTAIAEGRASVLYVDYAPAETLRVMFDDPSWKKPDLIEDGCELPSFDNESKDFIIACHVLEHTQDPIKTMNTWLSKLRPQGVLMIAVPHRDYCFDKDRALTSFEHLLRDFEGENVSERQHLIEWAHLNNVYGNNDVEEFISKLKAEDYRPHYHVWDTDGFLDFLLRYRQQFASFEIEHFSRNDTEILALLRKH